MAHPLTLPHPHCGHSFCGICILKHFFSQYHRACGNWHENVSCPMCRGLLNYTPSFTPSTSSRSLLSFPFAKNRAADSAICSLVQKLAGEKPPQKKGRGKGKSTASEDTDEALALWRHGGTTRNDWLDRNQHVLSLYDRKLPLIKFLAGEAKVSRDHFASDENSPSCS
jgi:hypothetical protein